MDLVDTKPDHGPEVHAILLDTCGRGRVAGFVTGGLQLLKGSVDVLKVTLEAGIGQRKVVSVLSHRSICIGTTSIAAASTAVDVVAAVRKRVDQASCPQIAIRAKPVVVAVGFSAARSNGERLRVALQPSTTVVVGARATGATLDIIEEVVKGINSATPGVCALDVMHVIVWVESGI